MNIYQMFLLLAIIRRKKPKRPLWEIFEQISFTNLFDSHFDLKVENFNAVYFQFIVHFIVD